MGRRIGTGGTSGVDYLDATSQYRIFKDLWAVRTILVKPDFRPKLKNADFTVIRPKTEDSSGAHRTFQGE